MARGSGAATRPTRSSSCCLWTGPTKSLTVCLVLFTTITVAQFYYGYFVAHSNELLVDCASMLVEDASFAASLWAACRGGDPRARARASLLTSFLSILVLYSITAWGLAGAVQDLLTPDPDAPYDARVVLLFGVLGLLFDAICVVAFGHAGDPCAAGHCPEASAAEVAAEETARTAEAMNMCSAYAHVVADVVRSLTSITLGLVVLLDASAHGATCDAYATLVVSATILLGSTALAGEWCRAAGCRGAKKPEVCEEHHLARLFPLLPTRRKSKRAARGVASERRASVPGTSLLLAASAARDPPRHCYSAV